MDESNHADINTGTEARAADTLLQRPFQVKAGDMTFTVPAPTVATVIAVSGLISRIPETAFSDDDKVLPAVLAHASECSALGDIAAMLILGEKEYNAPVDGKDGPVGRILRRRAARRTKGGELAKRLVQGLTPAQLNRAVTEILVHTEVSDFFALTTFLTGVNCLRRTKVGTEATRSGL